MKLTRAIRALGTGEFRDVLKAEIERLDIGELPLQRALSAGNYLLEGGPTVMINAVEEGEDAITVRVGLIFAAVDAGSCCANDPTPVEPHNEYCVIQLEIGRASGETRISLLDG